jgi:hypothetical protein
MNKTYRLAAALLAVIGGPALSATQGTAGATSTASFGITAQGPAVVRQVQVLNVADITLDNNSRSELTPSSVGATMAFCVVDNYGGGVSLTVTSANPSAGAFKWTLATTEGQTITYNASLTLADLSLVRNNVNPSNTFTGTISSGATVTSTTACGSGNLKFSVALDTPMPQTLPARTYSDTITMVASPI